MAKKRSKKKFKKKRSKRTQKMIDRFNKRVGQIWCTRKKGDKRYGKLYVIRCTSMLTGEAFIKVGITKRNLYKRFNKKNMPYKYEKIFYLRRFDYKSIYNLEQYIHKSLDKNLKFYPKNYFEGYTECFKIEASKKVQKIINEASRISSNDLRKYTNELLQSI